MKLFGKILRALTAAALAVALLPAIPDSGIQTSAAADHYRFDFGSKGVTNGFIGVSASDGYDAGRGYGFAQPSNMRNVDASGNYELSDAVQFLTFGNNSQNTFNVDLDNGLYRISVWLGDTMRTSVAAEGMLQIINMTGNNAYHSFQLPVTDGQLNINCTAGKENYAYTLSALEITKLSSDPTGKPTIWICGDSTVCNYYPLDTSTQAGWGQVFDKYVDTDKYEVRNLAASGQFAKGFVTGGQFDPVLKYGKEGDLYIISIGINDTNYSNGDEYYETVKSMSQQAMAKGMTVILVKQQGRADDISRSSLLTGRWFGGQLDAVGRELGIQVIDLFNLFQNHCLSIGQSATYGLYMANDTLHVNRAGAMKLSELIANEIDFSSIGTPIEKYETGDLNNDAVVNITDCSIMKRGLLSEFDDKSAKAAADLDTNGKVDSGDLRAMNRFIHNAGKIISGITTYYASDAQIINGITETVNAGYTGSSYINLANEIGSTIEFTVNVAQQGNYLCSFNIANGSVNDRPMTVVVNTATVIWVQPFLTTGAWTTWNERGIVLPLAAGENKIRLASNTAEGGPNFDYLNITLTDEPVAEPYDPNKQQDDPVSDNPTVFVASDSTAQSYNQSYAPQQGWGYYLGNYFSDSVTVSNHSIAGRSSKSFYDNGRLTTILDAMKTGDYLIVSFGINDGASSKPERYAPVCGYVDNAAEGSFEYYMKFYIEGALQKGGTPILVSPTLSIKNQQQPFSAGYRNIDSAMKMLAQHYSVPYFDLQSAMASEFNSMSYNTVYGYYMGSTTAGGTDFTHFTEGGADAVARILANGIKSLGFSLSGSVK